jgi:hypothetical protein
LGFFPLFYDIQNLADFSTKRGKISSLKRVFWDEIFRKKKIKKKFQIPPPPPLFSFFQEEKEGKESIHQNKV